MWSRLVIFVISILGSFSLSAQLDAPNISFAYEQTELRTIIEDLNTRYQLRFTYSATQLPLNFEISARVENEYLDAAIANLFSNTPIKYAFIGEQIALRADRGLLAQLETKTTTPEQTSPIYAEKSRPTLAATTQIPSWKNEDLVQSKQSNPDRLNEEELARLAEVAERNERNNAFEEYKATHRLAQISLLPYLGTNTFRSNEVTNNISFNIFWGKSYAIDGFEMGGIANSVIQDMHGFQFAGAVNEVGGRMTGTQIAGLVNHVSGKVDGLQLALAGANIGLDSVKGVQLATLFNVGKFHVDGTQYAGLFNWAEGNVRRQKSFLFNRAKSVEKRQVGLFNICDTSHRAPIGLFSFVKHGYNRVELGGSEEMFVQLSAKLGTHKFYNILLLGLRWDEVERQLDGLTTKGKFTSWSVGYGLGVANRLGPKSILNTEITASHVNELENWTSKLNLWSQFKLTYDHEISKKLSFYAGPTINMMWSKLYDPYNNLYGSLIVPRNFWSEQSDSINTQAWIGFTAGLRL